MLDDERLKNLDQPFDYFEELLRRISEEDLLTLNSLVEQYLLFAERQARRRTPMRMADWIARLEAFLELNEGNILTHAGKIPHELALALAEQEYDKFHQQRQIEAGKRESDFDKAVKALTGGNSSKAGK